MSQAELTDMKEEFTRALTSESLSLSDLLISKGACMLRQKKPSDIAAAIIYFARKNILFSKKGSQPVVPILWPEELMIMTRCKESQIKKLLKNPLQETDAASTKKPVASNSTLSPKSFKTKRESSQPIEIKVPKTELIINE